MTTLTITVYGSPAPQGSKRHVGHGVMVESSKKVKPWREAVKYAALAAIENYSTETYEVRVEGLDPVLWETLDGPLVVDMIFTSVRPAGHYRTGRNARLLRDTAPLRPASAPDLSKLARSTEDALTDAGIWRDDSRVVEYGRLAKVYAGSGDPDALDVAGAIIRVRVLADVTP